MKRPWLVALILLAGFGWAASRPSEPWTDDLELALERGRSVVALVAARDRPLSRMTRDAVDEAWRALRPDAQRVALECCTTRLGRSSALALFVFAPGGQLVARCDGPLDALDAADWLRDALDAAASEAARAEAARHDPRFLFAHADRALRLGDVERAHAEFASLAAGDDADLRARAQERLARLEIERGDVARAREHFALVSDLPLDLRTRAELLLTRGRIEFAARESRAACATLRQAADALAAIDPKTAPRARLELARAVAVCGEESRAIAILDELARSSSSRPLCQTARELASDLRAPPISH